MKKFTTLVILLVAGLVSYAQTAELEPNNSFATANYIAKDTITTGSISSASDIDYFVAHLPVDGTLKIYVQATNTSNAANWLYFTVFGSNHSQLTARYIAGSSSIASGAIIFDTITLYGRGVDSLFCKFQANAAFSYELKYEIKDISTNDTEPNDSFVLATFINQNENKSGHIKYVFEGQVDNYDYYRVKTSYDGTFKVYVKATNTSGATNNCYITVYGSNKSQLAAKYITGTSSIPAGAIVYDSIALYGRGVDSVFFRLEASGTFSYDVKYDVNETKNNDTEPNGSFATAVLINQKENKSGHIKYIFEGQVDNYDYYRAKTSYDGTFKVYVKATNTSGAANNCYLTVYGSNKSQLVAKYISGTTSIPAGAIVYDSITLYGRGVDSVFFRLDASGTFSYDIKYDVNETKNNDAEPNGSFATAVLINQNETKTGHIKYILNGIVDDYDYYRTKTSDDGTLKIYVKATNTGAAANWLLLTMYGSNKGQLASRYISGTTSIGFGATVYDTITLYGRGVDTVFYRFEASGTFSYSCSYEILNKSTNDAEPNGNFTSATAINQHEIKLGHIKYVLNGVIDDYDYYRTKISDEGTLKIYISATNTGSTSGWLYLSTYKGNHGILAAKYISGSTYIQAGAMVYDTLTIKGIGVDSVFFRIEANNTFSYSLSYEILTPVGIHELIKGKGQLSLGPNPATDMVYIGGLKQSGTFIISDLSGKKVLSGIVSETNNSLDIHQLTSGMYIISIYSNGSVESLKLLKTYGK
jgi:CRISPR/Cas system CSM-associated protein Csm4 (group 5 of RAMP superfamily)